MFFKTVVSVLMAFVFSGAIAQAPKKRNNNSSRSDQISILTKRYLGFDVYELPVVEQIRQLLKDSNNHVDNLIPATDSSRLLLGLSRLSFNSFQIPVDSMKLIIYEYVKKRANGLPDTAIVFQSIGYYIGDS